MVVKKGKTFRSCHEHVLDESPTCFSPQHSKVLLEFVFILCNKVIESVDALRKFLRGETKLLHTAFVDESDRAFEIQFIDQLQGLSRKALGTAECCLAPGSLRVFLWH